MAPRDVRTRKAVRRNLICSSVLLFQKKKRKKQNVTLEREIKNRERMEGLERCIVVIRWHEGLFES